MECGYLIIIVTVCCMIEKKTDCLYLHSGHGKIIRW